MTDTTATRTPSGAAVPGSQADARPRIFTKQLTISVTPEVYDRIKTDAKTNRTSKSDVARIYLDAGIAAGEAEAAAETAGALS